MVFQDEVQRIFSFAISQLHAAESTEGGRVEKKVRINMVHVHADVNSLTQRQSAFVPVHCANCSDIALRYWQVSSLLMFLLFPLGQAPKVTRLTSGPKQVVRSQSSQGSCDVQCHAHSLPF